MSVLLTSAQMGFVEHAAMERGDISGIELMERAGKGVVDAALTRWPELKSGSKVAVLCGPGNNGGDGFVIARLMKAAGFAVDVFLYGDAERLPRDAKTNHQRWGEGAASMEDFEPEPYDLAVDAIFGTGLTRALGSDLVKSVERINAVKRIVSVDVPSGLCADSGKKLRADKGGAGVASVCAMLTVTFQFFKVGHFLDEGPGVCGEVVCVDIGLHHEQALHDLHDEKWVKGSLESMRSNSAFRASLQKSVGSHKFSHGHVLVLCGGSGQTGAARLAARGALRMGAGLVSLGVPPAAKFEVASQVTAVMLREIADARALTQSLEDTRINVLCIGPALGLGEGKSELVAAALAAQRPTLVDADALTLIAKDPRLFAALHERCVLTPHAGEFARLFPDIARRFALTPNAGPAYSKVEATREAAKKARCTALFKGAGTVIANSSGACTINTSHYERAAPWLATAGAGDVLAGFIAGLLARGFSEFEAAETAAYLHTECALSFGAGLISEDLVEELPKVFEALKIG